MDVKQATANLEAMLKLSNGQRQVPVIVGEHVTLDANHPLAGKELVFEIELLEVKKPQQ